VGGEGEAAVVAEAAAAVEGEAAAEAARSALIAGARGAPTLATAARTIWLEMAAPRRPLVRSEAAGSRALARRKLARLWLGAYVPIDDQLVNGRFAYVRNPASMFSLKKIVLTSMFYNETPKTSGVNPS